MIMTITRDSKCDDCKISYECSNVCIDGTGNLKASTAFIVESPSEFDDLSGQLMSDATFDYIELACTTADIQVNELYFTSLISCHTPSNRKPNVSEISKCETYLTARLDIVKPKYVLLFGPTVAKHFLGHKFKKFPTFSKLRGKVFEDDGIFYIVTVRACELDLPEKRNMLQGDILTLSTIKNNVGIPIAKELNYSIVETQEDAEYLIKRLQECSEVAVDVETTGLDPFAHKANIISIGFGFEDEQICFAPNHHESPTEDWHKDLLKRIGALNLNVIAHNGKFDLLWLRVIWGWQWDLFFDTMLAHYLIDENDRHSLKHLSKVFYGAFDYDISLEDKIGGGPLEDHCEYLAKDVMYTLKLRHTLSKMLDVDLENVFYNLMMPVSNLFTEVEYNGVYIDLDKMTIAENFLRGEVTRYKEELDKYDKHGKVNWNSSQQVAKVLFDDLGLQVISETAKGAISTSKSVLKRIDHPLAKALLGYREVTKQLGSFIEGWKPFIKNSRLHPNFRLSGTVTGRPSCSDPNLQNVPRDPRIRSLITAPPGKVLVEFDLSQAELRLAADASQDEGMIEAFRKGQDIHWKTGMGIVQASMSNVEELLSAASQISGSVITEYDEAFDIVYEAGPAIAAEVDPFFSSIRKKAKAVNFGFIYGMWHTKFKQYAKDEYGVDVTEEEAEQTRNLFFTTYPKIERWHRTQKRLANDYGEVVSRIGRKRRLPDALMNDNSNFCRGAERQAINTPIQSFSSDWNLMVALQVREEFPPPRVRIIGTVHDSVLCEVSLNILPRFCERIIEIIREPKLLSKFTTPISVPMEGDIEIGPWGSGVSPKDYFSQQEGNK
jgi:uracil-DNA glycosylase family 4